MKKIIGLLWLAVLASGMLAFSGCEEDLDVERKNPDVNIGPVLDRIIAIVDNRSGERRSGEPVVLKQIDAQGEEVISEIGQFTTDASGEFEVKLQTGYYRAEFAYTPGTEPDVLYDFEVKEDKIYYQVLIEDPDGDFDPHDVTVTLLDAKTGQSMAKKDFYLYQMVRGGEYDSLGHYTTGEDGKLVVEDLYKGTYRIKAAYYPQTRAAAYNTFDFAVGKKEANAYSFTVEPILFVDDFSWWNPSWNLINTSGVLQSVKVDPWYTYNPDGTLANGGTGNGQRCDMPRQSDVDKAIASNSEWKDEYIERRQALDSTGLQFTATFGVLLRTGNDKCLPCWAMSLGSGPITGGIKTAACPEAPATFNMKVSVLANPGHIYSGNEWTIEANFRNNTDVGLWIEGGGYFLDGGQQVTHMVFDNPTIYDTPPISAPDHWNKIEAMVYGATPQTQILFTGGDLTARMRLLLTNIRLEEAY